jgi:hypothetical protein
MYSNVPVGVELDLLRFYSNTSLDTICPTNHALGAKDLAIIQCISMSPSVRISHRCRVLLRFANDVPCVDYAGYPTQATEKNIDEKICAASSSQCDRYERKPYSDEVEKDCALRSQ